MWLHHCSHLVRKDTASTRVKGHHLRKQNIAIYKVLASQAHWTSCVESGRHATLISPIVSKKCHPGATSNKTLCSTNRAPSTHHLDPKACCPGPQRGKTAIITSQLSSGSPLSMEDIRVWKGGRGLGLAVETAHCTVVSKVPRERKVLGCSSWRKRAGCREVMTHNCSGTIPPNVKK